MPRGVYKRIFPVKGHPISPAARAKIGDANRGERNAGYGKHLSPETCAKLSAANSGQRSATWRHGMTGTPTYRSWKAMLRRCTNPNSIGYKYWGGRGIKVCVSWAFFENFYADMGIKPEGKTLDRIDNDGNYEPSNCRWATPLEQRRNRRPDGEA